MRECFFFPDCPIRDPPRYVQPKRDQPLFHALSLLQLATKPELATFHSKQRRPVGWQEAHALPVNVRDRATGARPVPGVAVPNSADGDKDGALLQPATSTQQSTERGYVG